MEFIAKDMGSLYIAMDNIRQETIPIVQLM